MFKSMMGHRMGPGLMNTQKVTGITPFWLVLFIVFIGLVTATPQGLAKELLLWQVSTPKQTTSSIYLLGSVHVFKQQYYPLDTTIENAFSHSDAIAVELDISALTPQQIQQNTLAFGYYPSGQALTDNLSDDTQKRLTTFLDQRGLTMDQYRLMRPWLVSMNISLGEAMVRGFTPEQGIDLYFINKAKRQAKPIVSLETLEQQLTVLSGGDAKEQEAMLNQALIESEQSPTDIDDIIHYWRQGDLQALSNLLLKEPQIAALKPFMKRLLVQRNITMSDKIAALSQEKQRYFVVVGSAHLLGEDSIINLLKQKGFGVERLMASDEVGASTD